MRTQLVARAVAEMPAELAVRPRAENLIDMAALLAARRGVTPGPNATLAGPTFAEWLRIMRVVRAEAGEPVFGFPHVQKSECPIRRSDVVGQPGCVTGRGGEETS